MRFQRVFVTFNAVFCLLLVSTLLNCAGKKNDPKVNAKDQNASQLNASISELQSMYGIQLSPGDGHSAASDAQAKDWSRFNDSQRADIRARLKRSITFANRAQKSRDPKITNDAAIDDPGPATAQENAQAYLDSLDAYEKTPGRSQAEADAQKQKAAAAAKAKADKAAADKAAADKAKQDAADKAKQTSSDN